jgi:hypothetical protein
MKKMVELKIELPDRSLSVSGTLQEVEVLATRFWPALQSFAGTSGDAPLSTPPAHNRAERVRKATKSRKPDTSGQQDDGVDASAIANSIKARADFDLINSKILLVQGQWPDKCRLVAWIAERPITSGDVRRVMEALKIKVDLPTLSKALSANSSDFLTSGSNPVRYELTARAKMAFEQGLA